MPSTPAPELPVILSRIAAMSATDGAAAMLPAACYTSAAFFEFERSAVFAKSWVCVGRVEQIPEEGDCLPVTVAGEPLLAVRAPGGAVNVLSMVCQHRGQVIPCEAGNIRHLRCPLHFWTYDLDGKLLGAPRMGDAAQLAHLRDSVSLPRVQCEIWHGFLFVNLDAGAAPLAPRLAKLEPYWENYEAADLVAVPPVKGEAVLPWNWKLHFENFTDAYHPEYVHKGTHDFAPSIHPDGGVKFTPMADNDDAIVRTVPMIKPDGGMMRDGWGEVAEFPPISTLTPAQRSRITFAIVAPSMTLMFTPSTVSYQLITPAAAEGTYAVSDRVTGGGWIMPRSTLALPDYAARAARVREGAGKIWAQDLPINISMQAGKRSGFAPAGIYGPLETTLVQFNAWLLAKYQAAIG